MKKNFVGLKKIEDSISFLLKPIADKNSKKYAIINNLAKNWPNIIGSKYSQFCQPKTISFGKNSDEIKLTIIAFNSATGFFLKNNCEILIEKIAIFYGYKAISKIIIKQEPKIISKKQEELPEITEDKKEFIDNLANLVEDDELKISLKKLACHIFNKNDSKP